MGYQKIRHYQSSGRSEHAGSPQPTEQVGHLYNQPRCKSEVESLDHRALPRASVLIPGYWIQVGSKLDRALLVKFMQRTYQELLPDQDFAHLAQTVEQYFSNQTPLWWVELENSSGIGQAVQRVACLWLGNAVDQVSGDRHTHIFLLYVDPDHRHQGIGSALMHRAETWAKARGDRQIGLQVFQSNQPALTFYQSLGYQAQAFWMVKPLDSSVGG